jgi:hypothetical protein
MEGTSMQQMTSGRSYPFRFYGSRPGDWFEGANDGHCYELCFVQTPGKETRAAIAQCFEEACLKGPVEPAWEEPWLWSDRFALLFVGERFDTGDEGFFFSAIARLMESIHGIAPLEQVVFFGAREVGGDGWERWSTSRQKEPTAGPAYPEFDFSNGVYGGAENPSLPTPTGDPDFERARDAARLARQRGIAAAEAKTAMDAGEIALVPIDGAVLAQHVDPSRDPRVRALFGDDARARISPSGRVVVEVRDGKDPGEWSPRAAFIDDYGAAKAFEVPMEHRGIAAISVSARGSPAVLAVIGPTHTLFLRVSLPDGAILGVFDGWPGTVEGGVRAVACTDDLVLVLTTEGLYLFDPKTSDREKVESLRPLHSVRCRGDGMDMIDGGNIAVVQTLSDKNHVLVVGIAGRKLHVLGRLRPVVRSTFELGDRVFATSRQGAYELRNWEEHYARVAKKGERQGAKAAAKAKAGKAPGTGGSKPTLQPFAGTLPPDTETAVRPDVDFDAIGLKWKYYQGVSDVSLGSLLKHACPFSGTRQTPHAFSADGSRVAMVYDGTVAEVDLKSGKKTLELPDVWSEGSFINVAYTADDELVVLSGKKLMLVQRGARNKGEIVAGANVKGVQERTYFLYLVPLEGRRMFAVFASKGPERLVVFGVAPGRLKALVKFAEPLQSVETRGDRLFATDTKGQMFEVVGLEQAYAAFASRA